MEDHLKQFGIWAGVGAALGIGVALGMGLRVLATGALIGVGAGAAIGVASGLKKGHHHPEGMVDSYDAPPALH